MKHLELQLHTSVKLVSKIFLTFFALPQHKTSEHGIQMKSAEFALNYFLQDDDSELKEELQACQHFLVDPELKGEDIVFSISPCQPSLTLLLTRNWI